MRNADRFIRVIYKEADLASLMLWSERTLDHSEDIDECLNGTFTLKRQRSLDDYRDHAEHAWRRTIERYLRLYPKNYNEEEVDLLLGDLCNNIENIYGRDRFINGMIDALYLYPYCASTVLTIHNNKLKIKSDALLEWYGLFNKADPNIFYAAFLADINCPIDLCCTLARYNDHRLDHILQKGYSENHLHLKGGGYCAEISWHCFLYFYDNKRGAALRALEELIDSHWRDSSSGHRRSLRLSFQKIPMMRKLLVLFAYHASFVSESTTTANAHKKELDDVAYLLETLFMLNDEMAIRYLEESESFLYAMESYPYAYSELTGIELYDAQRQIHESPEDYWLYEQRFLRTMFESFLKGDLSSLARYAFNSYIVAYIQFKQGITQDNLMMGFRYFKRAEDQKEVFIDIGSDGNKELYKSMFHRYYNEGGIKYLELRGSPKSKGNLIRLIDDLNEANDQIYKRFRAKDASIKKIDFGIIIHFIKDGKPFDVSDGNARKDKIVQKTWREYTSLMKFFDLDDPEDEYVKRIVGIDAANYEIGTRPEVFGPLFRRFSHDVSSKRRTGITYHVGEDFITLCNGLRAIDDALEFLELSNGDRIGHGTALGLDADLYYSNKRHRITSTIQEHVDDLAWLHSLLVENHPERSDLIAYLASKYDVYIRQWLADCWPDNELVHIPTVSEYIDSYWLRGNDPGRYLDWDENLNKPRSHREAWECSSIALQPEKSNRARSFYLLFQYDADMKTIGSNTINIDVDEPYIEAVKIAQTTIRKKILQRGVSIETNPSSNWKISPVTKFIDLQTLHLNQHGLSIPENFEHDTNGLDIPLSINTDNGGIFQTDLATEYAYMLCAMKEEGFEHEEIYGYIDYLRDLSLAQSFVPRMKHRSKEMHNLNKTT